MVCRQWASARWDLWHVIKMSPAPVRSSWLKTNWLRWEPPRWEMRAQQWNTIDIDVETNCITRPQRSELTCSTSHKAAAAKSKTIHDPWGSFVTGHVTTAPLFSWTASVGRAVLSNREQESSQSRQRTKGRLTNLGIIAFAAAVCWQDATCARLFRLKVQWLDFDLMTWWLEDCFKTLFLSSASSWIEEQLLLNWTCVESQTV